MVCSGRDHNTYKKGEIKMALLKRFYSLQFATPATVGAMFLISIVMIGTGIFFEGHIKKLSDAKMVLL